MRVRYFPFAVLLLITTPWAQAQDWQSGGGVEYRCGGTGQDDREQLKAQRAKASAELQFTGAQGAYLSDVGVTVRGGSLSAPFKWTSEGPICLLKLSPGNYEVDATYHGVTKTLKLNVSKGVSTLQFRFPQSE